MSTRSPVQLSEACIRGGDMAVEDKQGAEQVVEPTASAEEPGVDVEAEDEDDVEAHTWRAQS